MIKGNEHEHENEWDSTFVMSRTLLFIQKTRNGDDEDDNVDHAKKGRKVGREAMIPNDTVM